MRHFKLQLLFVLFLIFDFSFAKEFPGDSVIEPSQRARSGVSIGTSSAGALSLLHSVPLASQVNPQVFVDYGPFTNESVSTMIVSLASKGMDGRRTLVGGFLGGVRYEGTDSITFEVPPHTVFGFSVKDFAELSISINHGHINGQPTGIPSATDFLTPTGKYLRCVEYGGAQDEGTSVASQIYYLYAAGSMSDKSTQRDYINQSNLTITSGIRPAEPGVCGAP
jgi:hypothetical protein